jgi:hypothetical protein
MDDSRQEIVKLDGILDRRRGRILQKITKNIGQKVGEYLTKNSEVL